MALDELLAVVNSDMSETLDTKIASIKPLIERGSVRSVQNGSLNVDKSQDNSTFTVSIASVNVNKTIVFAVNVNSWEDMKNRNISATIINPTTLSLTASSYNGNYWFRGIRWQVIEFY